MATGRPIRFGVQAAQQGATWSEMEGVWHHAEEVGFDVIWNQDHLLPAGRGGDSSGPCLEAWTLLVALADRTKRARLGCSVLGNTFRHPVVLAKMAATLDIISGGRLVFGLGASGFGQEHTVYGIPFYSTAQRISRFGEAIELIKLLWTQPTATFRGNHYQLVDAPFEPKPLQQPYPPIHIGGGGEKLTLRIVARLANEWNCFGSPKTMAHKIEVLGQHCREIGRDPAEIENSVTVWLMLFENRSDLTTRLERMAALVGSTSDGVRSTSLAGGAEEVIKQIEDFVAVGVTQFIFPMVAPFDHGLLERFAKDVIPYFRK